MEALRLAIELSDRIDELAARNEPVDARREALRLVRNHPDAGHSVDEVAEALTKMAEGAGAEVR
jgi:hypothetical protein